MIIKLVLALISTLFVSAQAQAIQVSPCESEICSQVSHNKKLETLSILVWNNHGQILHANQFGMDRTAKLVHTSDMLNSMARNDVPIFSAQNSGAPPTPCATGACSTESSATYITATHIITVTITFTYYNGQLVGVSTSESSVPRTDLQEEK